MFLHGVIGIFSSKKILFSVTTTLQTSARTEEFEIFPTCLYFRRTKLLVYGNKVIKTMGSPTINPDIRFSFVFPTIFSFSVTCLTSYHCWHQSIPRLLGHLLQLLILSKRNIATHLKTGINSMSPVLLHWRDWVDLRIRDTEATQPRAVKTLTHWPQLPTQGALPMWGRKECVSTITITDAILEYISNIFLQLWAVSVVRRQVRTDIDINSTQNCSIAVFLFKQKSRIHRT